MAKGGPIGTGSQYRNKLQTFLAAYSSGKPGNFQANPTETRKIEIPSYLANMKHADVKKVLPSKYIETAQVGAPGNVNRRDNPEYYQQ